MESYSMQLSYIGFFHLVICIFDLSSMSFPGLLAHAFLMLINIPFSGCATVFLPIYLLKDTFIAFKL